MTNNVRRLWPLIPLTVFVVLGVAVGFGWGVEAGRSTRTALGDLGPTPAYTLIDQLGQPVESTEFRGKVQVVSFLFPYCTTICPLIAAHMTNFMNQAVKPAGLEDRVQLVSFNVDPAGTGPRQMSAFMKQYGWDPHDPHWVYLTGDSATIRRIVTGGFHVSYERVSEAQEASGSTDGPMLQQPEVQNDLAAHAHVDYDIAHDDIIEVIGPDGRIRKIYSDADVVSPDRLLKVVESLLPKKASSGSQ